MGESLCYTFENILNEVNANAIEVINFRAKFSDAHEENIVLP